MVSDACCTYLVEFEFNLGLPEKERDWDALPPGARLYY